ncbi:sigma-54-dependent transcriptional regulator [Verrucomicrobiota bacterium sgz303538]
MGLERILIVDDEFIIRKTLEERLRHKRYAVSGAGTIAQAEKLLAKDAFDLVLMDVQLPDGDGSQMLERIVQSENPPLVVMITGHGSIESAVSCMRAGAFDYVIKPFSIAQIEMVLKKAEEFDRVIKVSNFLNREQVQTRELIGDSPAIASLKNLISRVARTDATVLIQGENGTGKELVANEIFLNSQRNKAPYIKVNCAAISETLIESEFFGHEKGSFTGATERREGRFELANGGTILLDEISEIPPNLQAKLLRVLQEKEFERVGGNKTIKVDVRVLATTNRNLLKEVEKGDFREDLYYRLNVFPLNVPPLRERRDDVQLLANRFLQRFAKQHGLRIPGFSDEAMDQLLAHSWPGNVRELQNVIERAAILAEDDKPISVSELGLIPLPPKGSSVQPSTTETFAPATSSATEPAPAKPVQPAVAPEVINLEEMEKRCILAALERTSGNRTRAAELLGISIRTLRNKLNQYKIEDAEDEEAVSV